MKLVVTYWTPEDDVKYSERMIYVIHIENEDEIEEKVRRLKEKHGSNLESIVFEKILYS